MDHLALKIAGNVEKVQDIFQKSIHNKTVAKDAQNLMQQFAFNTLQMRHYCSFIRQQTEHERLEEASAKTSTVEPYR